MVRCPWHGWEYDLATGQSWFDPRESRVRAYDVTVEPGSEICTATSRQPGPYVAETITISVEDDYVVIALNFVDCQAQAFKKDAILLHAFLG